MFMQEEDLRRFLNRFFKKHYQFKMALFDFKEWIPYQNAERELKYKFDVKDDYIEVMIIGSAYSYVGSRTRHNTLLRFTDNEVLLGYKYEIMPYVFELIDKLNKYYPNYVKKLQKRKNRRLISDFIAGKFEKQQPFAEKELSISVTDNNQTNINH